MAAKSEELAYFGQLGGQWEVGSTFQWVFLGWIISCLEKDGDIANESEIEDLERIRRDINSDKTKSFTLWTIDNYVGLMKIRFSEVVYMLAIAATYYA